MAKTLLKVANSLTKNVSSNKIITDTKKSEKNERKDRGRSLDAKRMARGAGILLAITSLPSSYGIGTLGDAAFQFIDLLVDLKQRYWQVLPIGPTSFGDSPYQSYSAFAGNPYLIDLDDLVQEKLLSVEEIRTRYQFSQTRINTEFLYLQRCYLVLPFTLIMLLQYIPAFHSLSCY